MVDDFAPARNQLSARLREQPDFEVVGEALDGLEAVFKAATLQPNVVIVDVALPKLNGIEVTRQIRATVPNCNVLFVTGNDFSQIVNEAFDAGANGYVFKSDAAGELFTAIRAVVRGRRYVSKKLIDRGFTNREPTP